jgi:hypothetical protein
VQPINKYENENRGLKNSYTSEDSTRWLPTSQLLYRRRFREEGLVSNCPKLTPPPPDNHWNSVRTAQLLSVYTLTLICYEYLITSSWDMKETTPERQKQQSSSSPASSAVHATFSAAFFYSTSSAVTLLCPQHFSFYTFCSKATLSAEFFILQVLQ